MACFLVEMVNVVECVANLLKLQIQLEWLKLAVLLVRSFLAASNLTELVLVKHINNSPSIPFFMNFSIIFNGADMRKSTPTDKRFYVQILLFFDWSNSSALRKCRRINKLTTKCEN